MCGGGYSEAKAYLATCEAQDAEEALQYLGSCEADFRDWTPLGHLMYWKRYYGLA